MRQPLEKRLRGDRLNVGRYIQPGCHKQGLPVRRVYGQGRVLGRQCGFSEQLQRERRPELILIQFAIAFSRHGPGHVDFRFGQQRFAVDRDESGVSH